MPEKGDSTFEKVDVGIMGRLLLWVKHFLGHHKTCGSNYSVLRLSFIMEW